MNGTPLLIDTPAGSRIFYQNRDLYPSPPLATAVAKAQSLPLASGTLYLLCSPLLWYGVAELVGRLPPQASLVIIELDPELYGLCDWSLEFQKLPRKNGVLLLGPAMLEHNLGRIVDVFTRGTRRVQSLGLNAGRMLQQSSYRALTEATERELRRYWRNRSTLLYMGRLWTRNLISNVASNYLAHDISLHPSYHHVVVAGAGPSLDTRIHLLREHRPDYFLVAVDTALPVLYRHGLQPDLVVALEGQLANLKDFIPGGLDYPALAFDLSSSPLVPRHFNFQKRWSFVSDYAPGAHWEALRAVGWTGSRIPALGSVGVAALYLCRFICSAQVFVIGLDFAWQAGATHATDSPARLTQLQTNDRLCHQGGEIASLRKEAIRVEGVDGQAMFSDSVLGSYRSSLDEVISLLCAGGLQVHDLRQQGLALKAIPCSEEQFKALLGAAKPRADTIPPAIPAVPASETDQYLSGKSWLRKLLQQTTDCHEKIDRYLHSQRDSAQDQNGQAILGMLEELDFLFLDIPDENWPSLAPSALTRAMIILDYYRGFILQRS